MDKSSLVIMPDEARDLTHQYVDTLKKNKIQRGVSSGIRALDTIVNPLTPGRMMTIMGRPGAGKTSLMAHYIREAALRRTQRLQQDDPDSVVTAPPIFVSAEMALEEIALREVSHFVPLDSSVIERGKADDWDKIHEAVDQIYQYSPVVYIAHSLASNKKRPRLSVEVITSSLSVICDHYGYSPELLAIDYAQRLRLDKVTRDRRMEVSEIVETVKDMALGFAVPTILGSQVGRQVDQKRPPIPELADAKETANLEETSDSILSVMRPSKYYPIGDIIPGTTLKCVDELFYIHVVKQRQGVSGKGIWARFDMAISRLTNLEMEIVDLNDY